MKTAKILTATLLFVLGKLYSASKPDFKGDCNKIGNAISMAGVKKDWQNRPVYGECSEALPPICVEVLLVQNRSRR